ncbi:hypothetical protein C2G38_2183403 [Gigaspora rosea]|uniref:Uncharacterized protein n=1 Tax=Gigaspora rosea TaxID=44941 RepID=A0A397VAA0_9GLOM|nr:hypothetical protein C2G38_2183403 [Gigaspora rosea]
MVKYIQIAIDVDNCIKKFQLKPTKYESVSENGTSVASRSRDVNNHIKKFQLKATKYESVIKWISLRVE